jgi:hypothetical protein
MSTEERLAQLEAEAVLAEATATPFRPDFEALVIPFLLDFPQFVEVRLLKPEHFTKETTRYTIAEILSYHEKHNVVPTRAVLIDVLENKLTEDDPHEEILGFVKRRLDPRDIPYVKEKLKDWLRDRAYGLLFSDGVEAYHRGDYQAIEDIVKRAARIYAFDQGEPFGFMSAEDFLKHDLTYEWLVEQVLVAGQPFFLGGKKKVLKTAVLCDLAVSLATATPFLGHFNVPKPRHVAFFSAESGRQDIQNRIKAIRQTKRTNQSLRDLFLSFDRPKLSDQEDLSRIRDFITAHSIVIVIVDPLYLTLLAGTRDVSASDLYQMGAVYGDVADAITGAGATPVLAHHFKKTVGKDDTDLDLDDFSFVGAAEFARQGSSVFKRQLLRIVL